MEAINETRWDLVLSGTGLPQSLLALALSRSDKKVLHTDKNGYYGGAEAALSLQDAEDWAKQVNESGKLMHKLTCHCLFRIEPSEFRNARIQNVEESTHGDGQLSPKLGFSRSYSFALCPQILYARSTLLSTLVSSKTYRQLEFLAVGSWWIYDHSNDDGTSNSHQLGSLKKIPNTREDVFADKSINIKSKRSLIKFVKLAADPDAMNEAVQEHGKLSFGDYLSSYYGLPPHLQAALHALTLSQDPPSKTITAQALPRINRHLTSFGVFGPGFNAVVPKWGGLAEVAQVACRASAVGGAVYMLGRSLINMSSDKIDPGLPFRVSVHGEDELRSKHVAGRLDDFPSRQVPSKDDPDFIARSIYVVSSNLNSLLPSIADDGPSPACSVVVFPQDSFAGVEAPIYLIVHGSDTGECPQGQTVLYASVQFQDDTAFTALDKAIDTLLKVAQDQQDARVLWKMHYQQQISVGRSKEIPSTNPVTGEAIILPASQTDLAFDDSVLTEVREVWQHVTGESDGFMQFDDREVGAYDDDNDE